MKRVVLPLFLAVTFPALGQARVITQSDLDRLAEFQAVFSKLMNDLGQSIKRPDISSNESDCIKSTWQELNQTSQELSSYDYLIDLVSGIDESSEEEANLRRLIRYALDKVIELLAADRKRLSQVTDQCIRFPISVAMSEQALRFVDGATVALNSIRSRF